VRDIGTTQMAGARPLIEVTLYFAAQFTLNLFCVLARCVGGQTLQCLRVFALETHQHFPWQRVGQAECDEVRSALAFDMRQVAARMDAAAERIRWLRGKA